MANSNGNGDRPGFDPYSAPTMIETAPVGAGAYVPPPAPRAPEPPPPPKAIGALLSEAFELYKKHAVMFVITAAVALAPVYLVKDGLVAAFAVPAAMVGSSLEADAGKLKELQQQMQQAAERNDQAEVQRLAKEQLDIAAAAVGKSGGALAGFFATLLALLLTIPFIILANYLAQAALVVAVADATRDGAGGWPGAWKGVMSNLGGLLLTTLLVFAGVAVGTVFCVVPGIAFGVACAFTSPVVLLEKKSGVEAIKRSIAFVKADLVRTIIVLIVFAVATALARIVGGLLVPDRFVFLDSFVGDLVSIAVAPFPIIGLVLLFQDIQRTRLEVSEDEIKAQSDALLPEAV